MRNSASASRCVRAEPSCSFIDRASRCLAISRCCPWSRSVCSAIVCSRMWMRSIKAMIAKSSRCDSALHPTRVCWSNASTRPVSVEGPGFMLDGLALYMLTNRSLSSDPGGSQGMQPSIILKSRHRVSALRAKLGRAGLSVDRIQRHGGPGHTNRCKQAIHHRA